MEDEPNFCGLLRISEHYLNNIRFVAQVDLKSRFINFIWNSFKNQSGEILSSAWGLGEYFYVGLKFMFSKKSTQMKYLNIIRFVAQVDLKSRFINFIRTRSN